MNIVSIASLQENTSYADLYTTLLNKISSLSKDKKFVLRELIATPPALIGRWFYENVNKGLVKNVELIVKAEGGVENIKEYKTYPNSYALCRELEKIFR